MIKRVQLLRSYLSCLTTKPTKWCVRPAKTQISLGIRPVWSESSLCTQWVAKDPSFLYADSEDSDQTGHTAESSLGAQPHCWFCHVAAHLWVINTDYQREWQYYLITLIKSLIHGCKKENSFSMPCWWLWNTVWQPFSSIVCWYHCDWVKWINQELSNSISDKHLSHNMTKPTKCVCTQQRLRSAWASAQSDQSLRCPHEESLGP